MSLETGSKQMSRVVFAVVVSFALATFGCAMNRGSDAIKPVDAAQAATSQNSAPIESVWFTSYEKAREEAERTGKLILADFTGSDWCGWCIKLKKDRLDTPEFKSWAKDNVVLLELDYPRQKPQSAAIKMQNQNLKDRYGVNSFPTILLLKPDGSVQAKLGYEAGKSATEWVQLAESRLQRTLQSRYVAEGSSSDGTVVR